MAVESVVLSTLPRLHRLKVHRQFSTIKVRTLASRALDPPSVQAEALPGAISGVVTVLGDPAAQSVRVYRRSDGVLVGETTSAADGTYQVTGLDPAEQHYVVALHGTLEYNAVVADNIVPEETS